MFQPPFEMENGHNMINMSTMNDMQMIPFDENDPEVIARRIKNRERQRRYRARKRQEADMKRAPYIISQPSQPSQPEVPETLVNNTPMEIVTRVYSQRNWKKDARRAHLLKQQQQQQQQNASSSISSKESIDLRNLENQSNFVDTRELSSTPSGRNWKAEARNKRK
ncbi:uncharacterized protein LOC111899260 [Lactuca sativa]|uniref:uncharacterized protein LOC111899260 n=1 Tax=Lactuca sativa TaxID=4236 RepID=UPI000CD86363|nr:uncharacterized protein LOC111899260 [Lactuca sativa]